MGEGNPMTLSGVDMAKELTLALIEAGALAADNMPASIREIHACLMQLKAKEEAGAGGIGPDSAVQAGVVDWRKSITKHAITCLECGVSFKQLSNRHFRQHGLDSRAYRDKYGIPRSQSLAARETTARRKQIVQESRPWEKNRDVSAEPGAKQWGSGEEGGSILDVHSAHPTQRGEKKSRNPQSLVETSKAYRIRCSPRDAAVKRSHG